MPATAPIETLAQSLYSACLRDLPEIKCRGGDPASRVSETGVAPAEHSLVEHTRRPVPYDCEIGMFRQTWGSTALGFGGIGGQAMTPAYTVIVSCDRSRASAVYFGGRFAYLVEYVNQNTAYQMDVANQLMADQAKAASRYVGVPS